MDLGYFKEKYELWKWKSVGDFAQLPEPLGKQPEVTPPGGAFPCQVVWVRGQAVST